MTPTAWQTLLTGIPGYCYSFFIVLVVVAVAVV
jgi:hypothetical protein